MKIVRVYKAQPTVREEETESVHIILGEEIPDFPPHADWKEMAGYYDIEAEKLVTVLKRTLPGGTLSRLTALLLQNMAGYLAVKWEETPDDNKSG